MVIAMIKLCRPLNFGVFLLVLAAACVACNSSVDERVAVPTSQPRVACTSQEGPRAARDAETAIAHAKGVMASVHEKNPSSSIGSPVDIARFEPYRATLKDGVWHVEGTVPPGYRGKVPIISVCKNDEGATAEWVDVP
jgi:hypothetical protein